MKSKSEGVICIFWLDSGCMISRKAEKREDGERRCFSKFRRQGFFGG